MKNVVILGAGTGGTIVAAKLARQLPAGWQVSLVDQDDDHVYQPGLLFVPFGQVDPAQLVRPRRTVAPAGVALRLEGVSRVDPVAKQVVLGSGALLGYDVLVVATGSRIVPEAVPGLAQMGWQTSAFDFYTLEGAKRLARRLDHFQRGRLLVHVAELPIKCPVAPLEFAFLADAFFAERGLRGAVDLSFVTPLDGAFTKPRASAVLGDMLGQRKIKVETDFVVEGVDGERRVMRAFDGRELDYDVLVTIPPHAGAEVVSASGMGDEGGWLPTDKHTLQSRDWPSVFALGDCTDVPTSKAGAVAHYQSEVLVANVLRFIAEKPLAPEADGHATCFVETGHGKAMLVDFNYDTEPLPGVFPFAGIGPFSLLAESPTNHWGKVAFEWLYWNVLMRGVDVPLPHRMSMAGKEEAPLPVPSGPTARERGPSRLDRVRAAKRAAAGGAAPVVGGDTPAVPLGPEGFLVDASDWTETLALATAASLGVELSAAHWSVVNAARSEFLGRRVSPNIRRLTLVAGVSTRELYDLFPRAPGKTVAKIAGIPKPVGCI